MEKVTLIVLVTLLTACGNVGVPTEKKQYRAIIRLPNDEIVDTMCTDFIRGAYSDTVRIVASDGMQYITNSANVTVMGK